MTVLSDQEFVQRIFEIAGEPVEHFEPFVFNNTAGDCIEFFVSNHDYYADRIDDYLTVYKDMDTEEIIGFVIKNIKRIFKKLSAKKRAMAFVYDDHRFRLRNLFVAMFFSDTEEDGQKTVIWDYYENVVKLAESNRLDEVELAGV